jgi:glyoxylase-like metal-dependent hydrolase (beta-lactamase superfamily II)
MPSSRVAIFFDEQTSTFSYVVQDGANSVCAIIDSVLDYDGSSGHTSTASADRIIAHVQKNGLQVQWILETHAHADHLSAAAYLKDKLGGQTAIGEHIVHVQEVFSDVFNLDKALVADGSQFDRLFRDNETFNIGELAVTVLHVPGHTPADIAYHVHGLGVFVGDTLFQPDVGTARCDFPGGSAPTLYQSIQRILALGDDVRLYLCHGYPPAGREVRHACTVREQRDSNIHVHDGISQAEFVAMRSARDATLGMPTLILPAIQINIRAGHCPEPEDNGVRYLKIPLNRL